VWLSTLGVAVLAYFTIALVQMVVRWLIASSLLTVRGPLDDLIIFFPMVVLIGYFAEQFRRRAAIVLGTILLISITLMTLSDTHSLPLWYRIAWFAIGPTAAVLGSALPSLRRAR